jgi:hypothetical protein
MTECLSVYKLLLYVFVSSKVTPAGRYNNAFYCRRQRKLNLDHIEKPAVLLVVMKVAKAIF